MTKKFRTTGHDVLPPAKHKPAEKLGTTPANRLAVYDHLGRRRGTVGFKATAATASRFLGGRAAHLSKDDQGKPCWKGKFNE